MKIIPGILFVMICGMTRCPAQTLAMQPVQQAKNDSQSANLKLSDLLRRFKEHYKVDILYADRAVKNRTVAVAAVNWQDKLEVNLDRILPAAGLQFAQQKGGSFVIITTPRSPEKKPENEAQKTSAPSPSKDQSYVPVTREIQAASAEKTISGLVSDEKREPLPGVSVVVKGTQTGTITDINGKYILNVPDKVGLLVFSYVGYLHQEVPVGNQATLDIVMQADNKALDEVVVVGYGTQKKATLTGSVASVQGKELTQSASPNVSNSIAGRIPGVIANNRSGRPGDDESSILIRGFNSFGGGTGPLIVVDGIPDRNFSRINSQDIESISVLKDASAAIYGVRSANGVILITTKRGKSGKPVINYSGDYSIQQLTRHPRLVNAPQYMTYFNEINTRYGQPAQFAADEIAKYNTANDPLNYPNTDWYKAVFRKNAPQTSHAMSVSGGSEQVKYFFSGQYVNQESNFKNSPTNYKQFNLRSNIDAQVSKNLSINLDLAGRRENRAYPAWQTESIMHELISAYPFLPAFWPNGLPGPGIGNGRNPAILSSSAPGYDNIETLVFNSNAGFNLKMPFIANGLSLSGYGAFDYTVTSEKTLNHQWDAYNYNKTTGEYSNLRAGTDRSRLTQDERKTSVNTYFLKLAFDREFGHHNIGAFVGYEQSETQFNFLNAFRYDLLSDKVDQLFGGSPDGQQNTGSGRQDARQSVLGRIAYAYKGKYLLEVSARRNGSFNFAPVNRWGTFPSVSAGWNISDEDFFKNKVTFIDQLKLRASWGLMGNDNVSQYQFLSSYSLVSNQSDFVFFGQNLNLNRSLILSVTPNPNITWEKQDSKNIGIDLSFLKGKLNATIDAFRYLRRDILAVRNASVPLFTGLSLPPENIGKSLNRGIDLSLGYRGQLNKFRYNVQGNFTYAKSKIIYRDESPNIPEWQKSEGQPINPWLLYLTNGVYKTQAEIDGSPHFSGAKPGDLWVKDVSGDGAITSADRTLIGRSATPQLVYGLNLTGEYRRVSISMLWSGQAMASQLILPQRQSSVGSPPTWFFKDRFTSETPDAKYPRAFNSNDTYNNIDADFWLRDASFIRLKSIELSYELPTAFLSKAGLSTVRFYVNGFNMFSIDKFKKFDTDPESSNVTGNYYPQTRIMRFGINISI